MSNRQPQRAPAMALARPVAKQAQRVCNVLPAGNPQAACKTGVSYGVSAALGAGRVAAGAAGVVAGVMSPSVAHAPTHRLSKQRFKCIPAK